MSETEGKQKNADSGQDISRELSVPSHCKGNALGTWCPRVATTITIEALCLDKTQQRSWGGRHNIKVGNGDQMAALLWAGTLRAKPGSHHYSKHFERNYIRHEGVTLNSSHIDPKLTHSSLPPRAADLKKHQRRNPYRSPKKENSAPARAECGLGECRPIPAHQGV